MLEATASTPTVISYEGVASFNDGIRSDPFWVSRGTPGCLAAAFGRPVSLVEARAYWRPLSWGRGSDMKHFNIVTLVSVIVSAAASCSHAHAAGTRATSKTVEQFAGCFAAAQERAAMAWSFVPQSWGGTFSNLGAKGARPPYFLAVLDRGSARQIRLESANAGANLDPRVARAVDQCI